MSIGNWLGTFLLKRVSKELIHITGNLWGVYLIEYLFGGAL